MPRSRILVVDDERMIRWSIQQALAKDGHSVATVETGEEAVAQATDEMPDLVFLDITLPGIDGIEVLRRLKAHDPDVSVVMVTATDDLKTAIEAMRLGACDYISKPFDLDRLRVIAQNAIDRRELRQEVNFHRKESDKRFGFHRMVGESPKILEVLDIARKVAKSEASTVLLQGESGTGKDLLAQAIHYEGSRAARPFIPINCTALPEDLLESDLMGHEKGAFTDAKSAKKGLFEIADGGTIFLDEIGDMKPGLQAKLLRFIENKAFRRVGGSRDIEVDVRIVAATNRNLDELVRTGQFREDLYFRLNVIPIVIPPLRDRPEDILPIARYLLSEFSADLKRTFSDFSDAAHARMRSYTWPGNVRELRNVIERALILGEWEFREIAQFSAKGAARLLASEPEGEIVPASTSGGVGREMERVSSPGQLLVSSDEAIIPLPRKGVILEEVEKNFIIQALQAQGGNQTKAALMLGLTRDALRYRMKKFDLGD